MNKILIGSGAIKHWFGDFTRTPKDTDYIVNESVERENGVEYLRNDVFKNYQHEIMLPNDLYTLKISHVIGWNISWEKHLFDVQFLKKKGCVLSEELFSKLYLYWNTVHGKNKRSDLDMTGEDFFDNAVNCHLDHDLIHTFINPSPTYKKILVSEVNVSEARFKELSHEERCNIVQEECMVMASERYKGMDYRIRYSRMLKKFIIGHAPLSVGTFAIENYIELHKPKFDFMKLINNKLNQLNLQTLN